MLCLCVFVKVPRRVKLEQQDSPHFHAVGREGAGQKVAPGMSATFFVSFTPTENKVLETEESLRAPLCSSKQSYTEGSNQGAQCIVKDTCTQEADCEFRLDEAVIGPIGKQSIGCG